VRAAQSKARCLLSEDPRPCGVSRNALQKEDLATKEHKAREAKANAATLPPAEVFGDFRH
jgi:hypothetical protein